MKKTIIKILPVFLIAYLFFTVSAAVFAAEETSGAPLPALHTIAPDSSLNTLDDDDGADYYMNFLDHPNSRYYVFNDFYNMESDGSLHILPRFETYQQTMENSCGDASALMVLNYFGIDGYNELDIYKLAGTEVSKGTSVEGKIQPYSPSLGNSSGVNSKISSKSVKMLYVTLSLSRIVKSM